TLPVWQNGIPQSIHRAPCVLRSSSEWWPWNSFQSRTRSIHCRATGSPLEYSMNPVALPMLIPISLAVPSYALKERRTNRSFRHKRILLAAEASQVARVKLECRHGRLFGCQARFPHAFLSLEHAPVIFRNYPYELRNRVVPGHKSPCGAAAARELCVAKQQCLDEVGLIFVLDSCQFDHFGVAVEPEAATRVENIGYAARHSRGKIPAGATEDHDSATGHIFAAMIADCLDYSIQSTVSDTEPFTNQPVDVGFAA